LKGKRGRGPAWNGFRKGKRNRIKYLHSKKGKNVEEKRTSLQISGIKKENGSGKKMTKGGVVGVPLSPGHLLPGGLRPLSLVAIIRSLSEKKKREDYEKERKGGIKNPFHHQDVHIRRTANQRQKSTQRR